MKEPWSKVRLIGVGVSKFESEERQLSLLEGTGEGKVEKLRRLSQAVADQGKVWRRGDTAGFVGGRR